MGLTRLVTLFVQLGLILLPLQLLLLVDLLLVEIVGGDEARVLADARLVGQDGWHKGRCVRRVRLDPALILGAQQSGHRPRPL